MEERWADWILQEEPHQAKLPFSVYTCSLPRQAFSPRHVLSTSYAADTMLALRIRLLLFTRSLFTWRNDMWGGEQPCVSVQVLLAENARDFPMRAQGFRVTDSVLVICSK